MHFRPIYHYIKFIHSGIYYRHFDIEGKENIPGKDEAVIIVSNHQNAINDPLALEYAFPDRTVNLFAHGNLFKNRFTNWFLRSLHIIPAYRMRTDGEESLSKNFDEFSKIGEVLFKGEWAGIFPEATNMTGHWLGEFSLGYLRMAFSAAETAGFEKEIKILPVSIHYDNYHRFRHNLLVRISPAIGLSQFYELYKTKPRTAQRQANQMVRESLEKQMLDIKDLENYEAIDYLRETYGIKYCASKGKYFKILSQKLDTDKEFVKGLEEASGKDKEKIDGIYAKALELKRLTREAGIRDWVITNTMSKGWMTLYGIIYAIFLFPLLMFGWQNIIVYVAPIPFYKKLDKVGGPFAMFKGGVNIVLNALVIFPLIHWVPFIIMMCLASCTKDYLMATAWLLVQPGFVCMGWGWYNNVRKLISLIRYRRLRETTPMTRIQTLRTKLWRQLDELFINSCK